jgi:hypothetical protein
MFSEYLDKQLNEGKKKWSGDVDTKWKPSEGFFEQSAVKIAKGLKRHHKDLKTAMSSLSFYINRAGKNLSADDKDRLNNAKEKLRNLFESVENVGGMGTNGGWAANLENEETIEEGKTFNPKLLEKIKSLKGIIEKMDDEKVLYAKNSSDLEDAVNKLMAVIG